MKIIERFQVGVWSLSYQCTEIAEGRTSKSQLLGRSSLCSYLHGYLPPGSYRALPQSALILAPAGRGPYIVCSYEPANYELTAHS